jgi:hypothetical protein
VRLLKFVIKETAPGVSLFPVREGDPGGSESVRRYKAVVITTLRQLKGLAETRIRLTAAPADAAEAIRFWLLPRLADRWQADGGVYLTDGWEIDFGGGSQEYRIEAEGDILCPFLGARWVHTALLGLERGTHHVVGPAIGGGEYFRAWPLGDAMSAEPRILPELQVIRSHVQWTRALDGPLGAALKRAWEEEM